ncbi:LuxR C-terminal-related transcriptional regulator [Plantactinospora sp. GCM10030261]|uniref:response regulator transcription factor n=1 Tax=Plantactinospora sp. GCM10030261 TaxID=3273420 RepID=UPI00360E978B
MRTVLVCVRTPLAAQHVASAAARLGLAAAVRTAVSDPEVMLRLAERPADVVLADTALTRPDSVGFIRRVLTRSPGAAVVLFGAEEPGVAAAAVAAGARGLISSVDHDLVGAVARAMLLLSAPGRAARAPGPGRGGNGTMAGLSRSVARPAGPDAAGPGTSANPGATPGAAPRANAGAVPGTAAQANGGTAPRDGVAGPVDPAAAARLPAQRAEDLASGRGTEPDGPGVRTNSTPDARYAGDRRSATNASRGSGGRRVALTEREMQVLIGMADGKSNAEIGRELFVSEDTVKTHARRLFRKLGARDRAHAVAAGFRAGLVA